MVMKVTNLKKEARK